MRRLKHLQFCVLLFVILCTVLSCHKRDALYALSQKDNSVTQQFFSLPSPISPSVLRIVATLKQVNERTGFIPQLANKEGFAVWNKAIVQLPQRNHAGRNATADGDTLVYIPLVLPDDNHVNAFIYVRLNGTVSLKLYRSNDYAAHGFGDLHADHANADKLAVQFMLLDFETFGHERFQVLDDSLFCSEQQRTAPTNRIMHIKKTQMNSNRSGYETWGFDVCMNTRYLDCTTNHSCCPDGSCVDCQALCWKTRFECQTVAFTIFIDDEDWYLTGTGSNGGGGGGGNAGTGQTNGLMPCNATPSIDNGLLPCPRGNTSGWIPYLPAQVIGVSDSAITDPCLKAIIDHIGQPGHTSILLRNYDEANYTPLTTHRYKVGYLMDTTLVGQNGQPIPGRTEVITQPDGSHFVSISLNNKLFRTASKEWVTAVILHELEHGIYAVTNPLDSTSGLAHIAMFENKVPWYIKQTLKDLYPALDEHDAFALGMDGLGLPDIFLIPDTNNPGMTVIDPVRNFFAQQNYFQTIAAALSAIVSYRAGTSGTPYC